VVPEKDLHRPYSTVPETFTPIKLEVCSRIQTYGRGFGDLAIMKPAAPRVQVGKADLCLKYCLKPKKKREKGLCQVKIDSDRQQV
jgi:hypothetical protein